MHTAGGLALIRRAPNVKQQGIVVKGVKQKHGNTTRFGVKSIRDLHDDGEQLRTEIYYAFFLTFVFQSGFHGFY